MVKINFHGGKNQFSSPVTPENFRARYAWTGNTLIWLAGIRGKACLAGSCTWKIARVPNWLVRFETRAQVTLTFDWLAFAVKLACYPPNKRMPANQMRVLPVHALPTRKFAGVTVEENWFLPPWKLIFTTMEIDFYHCGNWNLTLQKLILSTVDNI